MASLGCLSGSLSLCVCPSGLIRHSLRECSDHSLSSQRNCSLVERTCYLECDSSTACFTRISLTSRSRAGKNFQKVFTPTSIGNGTIRASRDSTFSAEATDSKSPEQATAGPSVQSHLDLLEQFTSESSANNGGRTIAEQLESRVDLSNAKEVTVPLAQSVTLETAPLTIHQKRNIRRQKYLDEVAKRNDAPFFTTVALFVILPPSVILGVAVATGYVQLFP